MPVAAPGQGRKDHCGCGGSSVALASEEMDADRILQSFHRGMVPVTVITPYSSQESFFLFGRSNKIL